MKRLFSAGMCLLALLGSLHAQPSRPDVRAAFATAAAHYKRMLQTHTDTTVFPHSINADGSRRDKDRGWWGSGFFGGSLWYLYEYTKDPFWREHAHRWTMAMEGEKTNTTTHDLGFMMYCPFGNGLRLTQNAQYTPILVQSARSLATRFDPQVQLIKSWDDFGKGFPYPVIIDNMMNLELLYWAAEEADDPALARLATTHANHTLKHHFRSDHSSYHVVCYFENARPQTKRTAQGAFDESAWARGQSWGLYGFTMVYRFTRDPKHRQQAERIADYILTHPNLPADKVPYWDFDRPGEVRDASAAAIAASALLELSQYSAKKATYRRAAEQMLASLASPAYTAKAGENHHFILLHSTGDKPHNKEVDVPLSYADYYYLEALLRYEQLQKTGKLTFR